MKKSKLILFFFLTLATLTQCKNNSGDTLGSDTDTRAKTISALINNDAYMNQVMDSMRTKHPDVILSDIFIIAKSDRQMQEKMMDKMADMCKADTALTKMMVSNTMKMLDDSKLSCCETGKMLMGDKMSMSHGAQADCCKKME